MMNSRWRRCKTFQKSSGQDSSLGRRPRESTFLPFFEQLADHWKAEFPTGMRLPFVVDLERSPSSSSFRHCGRRDCVLAVLGSFYSLDCHAASPLDRVREGGVSTTLRFAMVATFVLIGFLAVPVISHRGADLGVIAVCGRNID